jgi:phage terminase large subunit
MQCLLTIACAEVGVTITVVGATVPKLKEDVMRITAEIIMENEHIRKYVTGFNIQDRTYSFMGGSILEFKSFENSEQAKGGKRDYLYVNEATRIDYMIFWEAYMRTKVRTFIDYNPSFRFWVHEKVMGADSEYRSVKMLRSWHVHNAYLTDEMRSRIEGIKDKELWKVYARGLTGKLSGLVFYWDVVEEWPVVGVKEVIWGIDWGYTVDPTTCARIALMDDGTYVVDEVVYHSGIAIEVLVHLMREAGYRDGVPVYCDHDTEQVLRLRREGVMAVAAEKGSGAELNRVLYVKQREVRYTRRSVHLKDELGKYRFVEIDGENTNKIHKGNDHVIDSITMGMYSHRNRIGR